MIEHTEVSGRPATVAYLTTDWEPVEPHDADIAKVMFDDGDVVFLNLRDSFGLVHDRRDAYDPNQPRNEQGEWTVGGAGGQGQAEGSGARGRGGARSPDQASRRAAAAAAGHPKLSGLPDKPLKVGDHYLVPGPYGRAKEAAREYARHAGLPYDPPQQYLKVDKERATRIAAAFDQMRHDPDNAAVKASYDALAKETIAQWHAIKATGLKVEWIKPDQPDPYAATPRLAAEDVLTNNHWWGFPTDAGFGTGAEAEAARHNNPMLRMTDEVVDGRRLMVNDVFRIVHDYFGHFKEGVGFRADGEENAWRSHSAMYSKLARGAMTSETRGQNSWVNYGPYGESNRTASAADTHFAPQKIGLMPEWTWNEGRADIRDYDPDQDRDEYGRWTSGESGDVTAFHGTTADVAQKILKEGIKIGGSQRSFAVRHQSLYSDERGNSVYVADDPLDALRFAQFRSLNLGKLGAVVFEVHIPHDEWHKFKEDEQNEFTARRAEFNIPPAWIVKATEYDANDLIGSTGHELQKDAAVVVKFLTVFARRR